MDELSKAALTLYTLSYAAWAWFPRTPGYILRQQIGDGRWTILESGEGNSINVQPTDERVDQVFAPYARPGSPGCAVAVMKDGQVEYKQGYGLADIEHNFPILPSTVFNIGSVAKQFTAFGIALLEREGKLDIDDELRQHIPGMHDFGGPITLRHLLYHTSGLRDSFPALLALAEWRESDLTTTEDVLGLLEAQRDLNFRPGAEFEYTNSNYVLLASICERVSGRSFASFCRERIFEPLGMDRSVINDATTRVIPGRAHGYYEDGKGGWINAPLNDSVVGPTNVYTTVEDLAKWDENFYTAEVGGRALLERIQRPGHLGDGTELDYAFGLMVGPSHQYRGWRVVEHGGGQGGYSAHMMRLPELHLSAVVLHNTFLWDARGQVLKVLDCFLEDHPRPDGAARAPESGTGTLVPVTLSAQELGKKAGIYFDPRRAAVREVTYAKGQLNYEGHGLVAVGENRFLFEKVGDASIEFISAEGDAPSSLRTLTPEGEYSYERVEALPPAPVDVAQYEGLYRSPELDVEWRLVARNGSLTAHRRRYRESSLTPLFADAFRDDWGPLLGYPTTFLVVFGRDRHDTIDGLRVSGSGVRNLKFSKRPT